MSDFNAQCARAKRPCPLWVDAFQRDTQHLEADEVGAYILIIMAMWTRESCDFPDSDARLSRVSRVSIRLWRSRIGPVIREFLTAENGVVISQRLRREATYVERQVTQQSNRKCGEKSRKPLETNKPDTTTDTTTDEPRWYPSQQPNNPTEEDKSSSSKAADFYQRYLKAHPNPVESKDGEEMFDALVASGEDPTRIIAAASVYAEKAKTFSSPNFVQQSDNFLDADRGKWRHNVPAPSSSPDQVLAHYAGVVNGDKFIPASMISADMARRLIDAGLVSPERMNERIAS